MSLAIATNTLPSWWLGESEQTILTAFQLLDEDSEGS